MTTDDKPTPDAPPAESPEQPKVRVIELNLASLGELFGSRPKMNGIELQAAALATITVFKEASESAPKHLVAMLQGAWRTVLERLENIPAPGWEIQAQVLTEYFMHAGDWAAMRRCLTECGERAQSEPGDFQRRYEKHLETARKEHAAHCGSAG